MLATNRVLSRMMASCPCPLLTVEPTRGLVEEKLQVIVTRLNPNQEVTFHCLHHSEDKDSWDAFGHYVSDGQGTVTVRIKDNQVIWRDIILPIPTDPAEKVDVGQIRCPLLLVAGKDDQNWATLESAEDSLREQDFGWNPPCIIRSFRVFTSVASVSSYGQVTIPAGYLMVGMVHVV